MRKQILDDYLTGAEVLTDMIRVPNYWPAANAYKTTERPATNITIVSMLTVRRRG